MMQPLHCHTARAHAPRIAAALSIAALAASVASTAALARVPHVLQLCASLRIGFGVLVAALLAAQAAVVFILFRPALLRNEWPGGALRSADAGGDGYASLNADAGGGGGGGGEEPSKPPPRCWWRCARLSCALLLCLLPVTLWAAASAGAWLVASTVSPRSGSYALPGLHSGARLAYDGDGVAHITVAASAAPAADDEADLFFAQGFAHARARLWQMEFQRRVGSGTLAAAVGAAGLPVDRVMRTLGVRAAAERDYAAMAAGPARAALEAYALGVNAFTAAAVRGAYLPLEFRVLALPPPAAWSPVDSLVWQKIMAYDLCGNLDAELPRFALRYRWGVPAARVDELLPSFNSTNFTTVLSMEDLAHAGPPLRGRRAPAPPPAGRPREGPSLLAHLDAQLAALTARAAAAAGPSPPAAPPPAARRSSPRGASPHQLRRRKFGGAASNDWTIAGNLTASGLPIVANDPHLQLLAPSLWYLCHLSAPAAGIDVIGASFPGLPGVVIGRNARIAWGVTNTGVDVQDLYVIEPDPAQPDAAYLFDGASEPFTERVEVIDVAGGAALALPVRSTRHGPLVTSPALRGEIVGDDVAATGALLALRWVSVDPAVVDTTFGAFYALQKAAGWQDFREALALWISPSQNVVFGDVLGNFGYQMPGWVPTRNLAAGHTGAWPAPGNSSAFLWRAPWDYDALPRTLNPPRGFIASANNQVPPREWPYFLSADWDGGSEGYRAQRITELLRAPPPPGGHTAASVARIQTDYVSGFCRDLGRALAGAAVATPGGAWVRSWLAAAAAAADNGGGGGGGWDCTLSVDSWQASLYADVRRRLMRLGADETGGGADGFYDNSEFLLRALASDGAPGGADAACARAGAASCADFAGAALDAAAAANGIGAAGPPADGGGIARWGRDLHLAAVQHQVLAGSPLACLADRAVAHGGEDFTVNVGGYSFDDGAKTQTHGPSVRHIMELADAAGAGAAGGAPASLWMQPLGQEGDILAPAYDGLLARWAAGTYMSMSTTEETAGGLITLTPA